MMGASDGGPDVLTGRDLALSEVAELLLAERVVTVTGPGGVGKSALATELARRLLPERWQVVGRADLARLDDPQLLPERLAHALGTDGRPGRDRHPAPAEAPDGARALLIVDTCEHLADACAEAVAELAAARPGLHVLATSRTPMPTIGHYPLRPLPLDDAARLFTTSVRRRGPGAVPSPETARRICAYLDGLPLAVRIAADQLAGHSPDEVLSLVSRPETLLDLAAPELPARQRTLRDSLLRTHRLCTWEERLLWARCTVFPGSFGPADALEVCADERLPAGVLAAAFDGLVRHALVLPLEAHGTVYRMPWVTRALGRQLLDRLGEEREFLRRCLAWSLREP